MTSSKSDALAAILEEEKPVKLCIVREAQSLRTLYNQYNLS